MATYSLNQLIKIFNDFADSHLQIKSFGFGEIWEANGDPKETGITPVLWVFPTQSLQLENTIIYSFDVRCWDLVHKDESNDNEVLSDTHQILSDFTQFVKHNTSYDFNVSGDPTMTPFTEQLADNVTGWQCSIDIEVNSINNDCMIPLESLSSSDIPLNCPVVTITDGDIIVEKEAGEFYTCTGGGDATVNVNNTLYDTVAGGDTLNIPILNSANTNIGTISAGVSVTIGDSTAVIKNSAGTTLDTELIPATVSEDIILPDITLTQPNGDNETKVAGINLACTLIENLSTQDLNDDLTPTQINQIQRQQPTRTGQTTSYRTGDDGDLELGIGASFSTLSDNNIWGNTNRFTDDTGAQTYANDFVLDHLTGLMWYRIRVANVFWNDFIDTSQASTQGGFTDWFAPNIHQLFPIMNWGQSGVLNYVPFSLVNNSTATTFWSSTTSATTTTNAYAVGINNAISSQSKTSAQRSGIYCRRFIPSDFGL
jgi:hypothetical protein